MAQQFGMVAGKALAHRPATSVQQSRQNTPDISAIVAHLTACLALVRPVGMPDSEAGDWLRAAASALADYKIHDIATGCRKATRECTHYAQIVPSVSKHCESVTYAAPRREEEPFVALPPLQMTQEEVDRIVSKRGREMSVALDRGQIVKKDGQYVPA